MISLGRRDLAHEVVVIERNRPDDTFGWGVRCPTKRRPISKPTMRRARRSSGHLFVYWDDIAVHYRG
jgi:anthraniloyl-CoA monooxygenase